MIGHSQVHHFVRNNVAQHEVRSALIHHVDAVRYTLQAFAKFRDILLDAFARPLAQPIFQRAGWCRLLAPGLLVIVIASYSIATLFGARQACD
jgi:hypothetical protein